MFLTKEKITDGKDNSFWHSKDSQPSWMNYNLNTPKIITEVIVGVRQGLTLDISKILLEFEGDCCQDRYNKMCVTLNCQDGSKLDEKCTTGSLGEPYLTSDKKNIIVPFDSVVNVGSVKVSFNDNKPGQIRTFIVKGNDCS